MNLFIAIGNGACNIASTIKRQGLDCVKFALLDTEPDDLQRHPGVGEAVVLPSSEAEQRVAIGSLFAPDVEKVFIVACLGGHTGSSIAPLAAGLAREAGKEVACLVTMPFDFEGRKCRERAETALSAMRGITADIRVFHNEDLRTTCPDLDLFAAFQMEDRQVGEALAAWLQEGK